MGLLDRLLGRNKREANPAPQAVPQKQPEGTKRPSASKASPRHLSLNWSEWDKPDAPGEDDSYGRGFHVHDEDDVRWQWREEGMAAGLCVTAAVGPKHTGDAVRQDAFAPGNRLVLVPEPDNPYDSSAIGVWDEEKQTRVGYLPKTVCGKVATQLGRGKRLEAFVLWEWINRSDQGKRTGIKVLITNPDIAKLQWSRTERGRGVGS